MIEDAIQWLETPIHAEAPVTAMDILADQRFDLAIQYTLDRGGDPERILNALDPDWQTRYASPVKVFVASDGRPGLRLGERIA